jgi:signal transduction histidine kinase
MSTDQVTGRLRLGILGSPASVRDWTAALASRVDVVQAHDLAGLLKLQPGLILVAAPPAEAGRLAAQIAASNGAPPVALLVTPEGADHPMTALVRALVEGKREWEATFDAIVDPVAILDQSGLVIRANMGLAHALGRPIQEVVSQGYISLLGKALLGYADPIALSLADRSPRTEDARFEKLSGVFQITTSPLSDDDGAPLGLVVILKDVHELREQQERLLQAMRLADIGLLAAGVAHEINTPLASIALRAESLLRAAEDPALQAAAAFKNFPRYLKTIDSEIFRCKKIISALLDFSRVRKPEIRETDVNQLAERAADLVGHQMKLQQVNLALRLEPTLPHIHADDDQLRQALIALLMNALDAVSAGGNVTVETQRASPETVSLAVSDDGVGIPPEHLDKIFNPFFTTKPLGQGTGLGLAICHGIVASHGGEIEVESAPGRGTRIRLVLPLVAGPSPTPPASV